MRKTVTLTHSPTGLRELDDLLGGGFPTGETTYAVAGGQAGTDFVLNAGLGLATAGWRDANFENMNTLVVSFREHSTALLIRAIAAATGYEAGHAFNCWAWQQETQSDEWLREQAAAAGFEFQQHFIGHMSLLNKMGSVQAAAHAAEIGGAAAEKISGSLAVMGADLQFVQEDLANFKKGDAAVLDRLTAGRDAVVIDDVRGIGSKSAEPAQNLGEAFDGLRRWVEQRNGVFLAVGDIARDTTPSGMLRLTAGPDRMGAQFNGESADLGYYPPASKLYNINGTPAGEAPLMREYWRRDDCLPPEFMRALGETPPRATDRDLADNLRDCDYAGEVFFKRPRAGD